MSSLNKLRALNKQIIFTFLQDTSGNYFHETTKTGLVLLENKDKQLKPARWGKVERIGKDVSSEIKIGDFILIEPLMWTTHLAFEGEKFWVTSEDKVMCVSEENIT